MLKYERISLYYVDFDGSSERFLVYYNPAPKPYRLAVRINE